MNQMQELFKESMGMKELFSFHESSVKIARKVDFSRKI